MSELYLILLTTLQLFVGALELLMLARLILPFLPLSEDNRLLVFVFTVTEMLCYPVSALFDRFKLFANSPLDVSYLVTYLLLWIISTVLALC